MSFICANFVSFFVSFFLFLLWQISSLSDLWPALKVSGAEAEGKQMDSKRSSLKVAHASEIGDLARKVSETTVHSNEGQRTDAI